MRKFILIVCLPYLVFSCKDEDSFKGRGLILLSPNVEELKSTHFEPGDSLIAEFVYSGAEDLVFLHGQGNGTIRYLKGALQPGTKESTNKLFYFGTNHRDLESEAPFKLGWEIPEGWENTDFENPKIFLEARTLRISVFTENHILVYEYELSSD